MNTQIVGTLKSCINKLTELLQTASYPNSEDLQKITDQYERLLQISAANKYKKSDQMNYFEYFRKILSLPDTEPIMLKNKNEPFTLKEDLIILTIVASNQHKVPFKVLQQYIKKNEFYKCYRVNRLIKRKTIDMFRRYKFLTQIMEQNQVQFIVKWIQRKGINHNVYILKNINSSIDKQIKIKISEVPYHKKQSEQTQIQLNEIGKQVLKENFMKRAANYQYQCQANQNTKKKIKKDQEEQQVQNNYQTPDKRIQIIQPQAPLKPTKDQSEIQVSLKNIFKPPNKKVKVVKFINEKRQVILKTQPLKQQSSEQQQEQKKRNTQDIQINQFKLQQSSEEQKTNEINSILQKSQIPSSIKQQTQQNKQNISYSQAEIKTESKNQQQTGLRKILKQLQQKYKIAEVRILKYLNQLSGDLNQLRIYLENPNTKMRWTRVQDSVLKKHYSQNKNVFSDSNYHREVQLKEAFDSIKKQKGEKSINKRIKYLGLQKEL